MNRPLELRFIPKWLNSSIQYHQTGYANFESIVSRHDLNLYKVANNLFQTALKRLLINDFVLPSAVLSASFSEDDALFALYGNNPDRLTVPDFNLTRFTIQPDPNGGILVVEGGDEDNNLVLELLLAIALYQGDDCAYRSSSFKRYLISVNKNAETNITPAASERYQTALKRRLADMALRNQAELAKEDL